MKIYLIRHGQTTGDLEDRYGGDYDDHLTKFAVRKSATKQPYRAIAILSHGGPLSFIFREVLKLGDVHIEDCGFAELEKINGRFSIIKMDGITLKK